MKNFEEKPPVKWRDYWFLFVVIFILVLTDQYSGCRSLQKFWKAIPKTQEIQEKKQKPLLRR